MCKLREVHFLLPSGQFVWCFTFSLYCCCVCHRRVYVNDRQRFHPIPKTNPCTNYFASEDEDRSGWFGTLMRDGLWVLEDQALEGKKSTNGFIMINPQSVVMKIYPLISATTLYYCSRYYGPRVHTVEVLHKTIALVR